MRRRVLKLRHRFGVRGTHWWRLDYAPKVMRRHRHDQRGGVAAGLIVKDAYKTIFAVDDARAIRSSLGIARAAGELQVAAGRDGQSWLRGWRLGRGDVPLDQAGHHYSVRCPRDWRGHLRSSGDFPQGKEPRRVVAYVG